MSEIGLFFFLKKKRATRITWYSKKDSIPIDSKTKPNFDPIYVYVCIYSIYTWHLCLNGCGYKISFQDDKKKVFQVKKGGDNCTIFAYTKCYWVVDNDYLLNW